MHAAAKAFVNLHSGEYAVYVPWDSKKSLAPKLPADINDVLERIDSYCQCMHGAAGAVAGWALYHPCSLSIYAFNLRQALTYGTKQVLRFIGFS